MKYTMLLSLFQNDDISEAFSLVDIFDLNDLKRLLCTAHALRSSRFVYFLLKCIQKNTSTGVLIDTDVYLCFSCLSLQRYNVEYKAMYSICVQDLMAKIPVLQLYCTNTDSHDTIRCIFSSRILYSGILDVFAKFLISNACDATPDINALTVTLYCNHRCVVVLNGYYHYITNSMKDTHIHTSNSKLVHGLIINSNLTQQYNHLDVLSLTILQALCDEDTVQIIFEYMLDRFYLSVEKGNTITCLFLQDAIVHIISNTRFQVTIRNCLNDNDIIDTLVSMLAVNQNIISRDMHLAFLCVISECVRVIYVLSVQDFGRIEQLVYTSILIKSEYNIILHENYLLLLFNSMCSYRNIMDVDCLARVVDITTTTLQQISEHQTRFNGIKCLKYLIDNNKTRITEEDLNRICLFVSRLQQWVKDIPAHILSDILYILSITSRNINKETWFATVEQSISLGNLIHTVPEADIKSMLQIIRNYVSRQVWYKPNMLHIHAYSFINEFIQKMYTTGNSYSNTTLYWVLETMLVMFLSNVANNNCITHHVVYVCDYILTKRRIKSHFCGKITRILTQMVKSDMFSMVYIKNNLVFQKLVVSLTSNTQNYKKTIELLLNLMTANQTTCLCNYNKILCHSTLSFFSKFSSSLVDVEFDLALMMYNIMLYTVTSTHHIPCCASVKYNTEIAIDEFNNRLHASPNKGAHWDIIKTQFDTVMKSRTLL